MGEVGFQFAGRQEGPVRRIVLRKAECEASASNFAECILCSVEGHRA
jgi:hypothetical protein